MFKTCACCHQHWITAKDFVSDPQLTFIGIQEDKEPEYNAAAFLCRCGTSLYVMLEELMQQAGVALDQLLKLIRWRARDVSQGSVVGMLARALEHFAGSTDLDRGHPALLHAG